MTDMAMYMRERRLARRDKMLSMLGGVCVICGNDKNLEINHIDPRQKSFSISDIQDGPWDAIVAELSKCELLCGPHHKEATKAQWQAGLLKQTGNPYREYEHGSPAKYNRDGCRCPRCKKAKQIYRKGGVLNSKVIA